MPGVAVHDGSAPTHDVVVVGAGIAGLVTALELLDRGRDVLLLDRCEPQELGGLAREAFGGLFMVDSPEQRRGGIRDSYELALDDWVRTADFEPGDEWPRRWAEQYVRIANREIRDPPEHMLMGSHYYADGAMHDEVERIGGNVTNLERMWNYGDAVHHPRPRRPLHGLKLIPPRSGLFMDPTGRRVGPRPVIPTFDA